MIEKELSLHKISIFSLGFRLDSYIHFVRRYFNINRVHFLRCVYALGLNEKNAAF